MALKTFRVVGRLVERLVAKKGMAETVLSFAEFAASRTKSKEDDKVVAKLKAALSKSTPKPKKTKK
jgi:hypothetical protein|tara:strand:- start:2610 stop:2807 length:198 start_codon:yes stop_codon:yes gene_type:complete